MLEPILSPDELWPGGIPSSIRLHADASLSERDDIDWTEDDYPYSADEEDADLSEDAFVREESKGWCQFVHVRIFLYYHFLKIVRILTYLL